MEDKREDKNLNEAEGRVVEAEKKKLALKAVNPMIFLVVIIALCAIASYIVPAGTYDRVLDAASGRENRMIFCSMGPLVKSPVRVFCAMKMLCLLKYQMVLTKKRAAQQRATQIIL